MASTADSEHNYTLLCRLIVCALPFNLGFEEFTAFPNQPHVREFRLCVCVCFAHSAGLSCWLSRVYLALVERAHAYANPQTHPSDLQHSGDYISDTEDKLSNVNNAPKAMGSVAVRLFKVLN